MDDLLESTLNGIELPLVIRPKNEEITFEESLRLITDNKELLKAKLLKNGGILFRDFPVSKAEDFSSFITAMDQGKFIDYIGGDSPRNKIGEGIYTSTEAPPSVKIPLHNELSFVKHYPKHIYFYCHIAPREKGETIIADSRKIYQSMDSVVKKKFIEKGIKYQSCYYYKSSIMNLLNRWQRSHKSWIDVFETEDKNLVEEKCQANEFGFMWHQNDWLRISQERPAIMKHPITQENVWFNQAHLYDFNPKLLGWWRYFGAKMFYIRKHMRLHEVAFGDGSKIPRKDLYHILKTLDDNTVYFKWQKGDLLVLDNVLTMHGRATFKNERRILTAMTG